MGSLILPSSGPTFVDADALIYTVQRHPTYYPLLIPFWAEAEVAGVSVLGSELLILETLVVPLRAGDDQLVAAFERALYHSTTRLVPITGDTLNEAARLRATVPALRAPDAIHAATARVYGCTLFVTNDVGYRRIPELPVAVLDDILSAP